MTNPQVESISLTEVRERFLQAESALTRLAATMQSIQAHEAAVQAASGGISEAREGLIAVGTQLGGALHEISATVGLVRQAVALLERSDPGIIQGRLTMIAEQLPLIDTHLGETAGTLNSELSQRIVSVADQLSVLEQSGRNELRAAIESLGVTLRAEAEQGRQSVQEHHVRLEQDMAQLAQLLSKQQSTLSDDMSTHFADTSARLEQLHSVVHREVKDASQHRAASSRQFRIAIAGIAVVVVGVIALMVTR